MALNKMGPIREEDGLEAFQQKGQGLQGDELFFLVPAGLRSRLFAVLAEGVTIIRGAMELEISQPAASI